MEQYKIVLEGSKQLKWQTDKIRPIQDEIIVKTIAGAISIGAELPQYKESDISDVNPLYPRETGYESYGEVIQVGNKVTNWSEECVKYHKNPLMGILVTFTIKGLGCNEYTF